MVAGCGTANDNASEPGGSVGGDGVTATSSGPSVDESEAALNAAADGLVDDAEMEAALFRFGDCMSDGGFKVDVRLEPGNAYEWDVELYRGDAELTVEEELAIVELANRTEAACQQSEIGRLGAMYFAQNEPSPSERAEIEQLVRDCLTQAGQTVADDAQIVELQEIVPLEVLIPCMKQAGF